MTNNYLLTVQAEYLANPESKALAQLLFAAIYDTAMVNLKSLLRSSPGQKSTQDLVDFANDVTIEIMSKYQKPGWRIETNPGKLIHTTCFHHLFDPRYIPGVHARGGKLQQKVNLCSLDSVQISIDSRPRGTLPISLRKQARKCKTYQKFLGYLTKQYSLNWIRDNIDDILTVWQSTKGEK